MHITYNQKSFNPYNEEIIIFPEYLEFLIMDLGNISNTCQLLDAFSDAVRSSLYDSLQN